MAKFEFARRRSIMTTLVAVVSTGVWLRSSLAGAGAETPEPARPASVLIAGGGGVEFSAERYLRHITLLAHDRLKGRDTGSSGIDIAAGYIAGQFTDIGLKPGGTDGSYFHEFKLNFGGKLADSASLSFSGVEVPQLSPGQNWTAPGWSAEGTFSGDVVFVGYGIIHPEKNHGDYAGVDVKGKVAFMVRREPAAWRSEGGSFSRHSWFATKVGLAREKGAVGVIFVNQATEQADSLSGSAMDRANYRLPAVQVKREVADALFKAAGMDSLAAVQQKLDAGTTCSQLMGTIRVNGAIAFEGTPARNIIGLLPGTGPNADEYVIIGAHYDHIGEQGGQIHNGADDNASGTAGVIEVARAMAATPGRNRSAMFITFSGEERGLLGSAQFCADPTVPLDRIIAMLNMDMIGRLADTHENMLAIQGLGTGDCFKEIVDRHAKAMNFDFLPDDSARGPSDHASFYNAGIPSLFFFTGIHPDYHQPGDDTPKINAIGGANVAHLVYNIALDLVNRPARPVFARVDSAPDIFRGQRPGAASGARPRAVLGVVPAPDDGQRGWLIASVSPDMPAAKAGMKDGDRIIRIGERAVNNLADYLKAIEDKKPGDEIEITVLRGTEETRLKATLTSS